MTTTITRTVKVPKENETCKNLYMRLLKKCNREGYEHFLKYLDNKTDNSLDFWEVSSPFTEQTGLSLLGHTLYVCKEIISDCIDEDEADILMFCALLHALAYWNIGWRRDIEYRTIYIAQTFFDLSFDEIGALKYYDKETPEALECFKTNNIALKLHLAFLRAKFAVHGTDEDSEKEWIKEFLKEDA